MLFPVLDSICLFSIHSDLLCFENHVKQDRNSIYFVLGELTLHPKWFVYLV